jgi:hypothetical protein
LIEYEIVDWESDIAGDCAEVVKNLILGGRQRRCGERKEKPRNEKWILHGTTDFHKYPFSLRLRQR